MKKLGVALFAVTAAIVLVVAFTRSTSSAVRNDCSCSARDGSCSASGSCSGGGCTASCPSDGCNVHCSGFYSMLQTEMTLQMQGATNKRLVAEVARVSGKEVAFSSKRPDVPFNLDVKGAPLWDVLEILSDNGTLLIGGEDFEKLRLTRRALLSGEKISMCVQNTPVSTFVTDLAGLTGLPIHITGGNARATVNVKLRDVTLQDIIAQVSEQTGAKITEEDGGPGAR